MTKGKIWIVVADASVARFFERLSPGADIVEREDLALRIADEAEPRERPGRVHDRFGPARHGMEARQAPHDAAETRFLKQVSDAINAAAESSAFESFFLCAPPRALGALRGDLSAHAQVRLKGELGKDLTHVPVQEMGARLHDLLQWPPA